MTPVIWTTLLILNKFLVYVGVAGAIGGSFSLFLISNHEALEHRHTVVRQWRNRICKSALMFICIGFIANIADFFVQTGNMSETGLSGMLEPIMLEMLWVSSVGTITVVRSIFLALSAVIMLIALRLLSPHNSTIKVLGYGMFPAVIALGLSYSFSLSGHTSDLDYGSVTLIMLHVVIAFSWLGSLLPLLFATTLFNAKELHVLMTRFGRYASWLVALLLVAGTGMLIQLVASADELMNTAYGQLILTKIALVLGMLVFAIWHKFHLVPKLLNSDFAQIKLKRSIIAESAVGLLVLITTSIVTTAVGPAW